jgi:hypothetical protein
MGDFARRSEPKKSQFSDRLLASLAECDAAIACVAGVHRSGEAGTTGLFG